MDQQNPIDQKEDKVQHMKKTRILQTNELCKLTMDARVVALRWDLVPWALVLDLDVPESEEKNSSMYRAWLVFSGISELSLPLDNVRIPTGFWLTSQLSIQHRDEFKLVSFLAMLPIFKAGDSPLSEPTKEITIRTKVIEGVISINNIAPSEYGLIRKDRLALASDEDMLLGLTNPGRLQAKGT